MENENDIIGSASEFIKGEIGVKIGWNTLPIAVKVLLTCQNSALL